MTDENDNTRPPAGSGAPPASGGRAPLTLKPRVTGAVSAGVVKQSFSHGRSKTVVVERTAPRRRVDAPTPPAVAERRAAVEIKPPIAPARPAGAPPPAAARPAEPGHLSESERLARQRAIEMAARQNQERLAAERDARARAEAQAAAERAPPPRPPRRPGPKRPPPDARGRAACRRPAR